MNNATRFIIVFLFVLFSFSCGKVEIDAPEVYDEIQLELENKNYEKVLDLLLNSAIPKKQKVDWYYYALGISVYHLKPNWYVREAIGYLKIAYSFNPNDYFIAYYLGQMNFEICEYEKAIKYFENAEFIENENLRMHDSMPACLWLAYVFNRMSKYGNAIAALMNYKGDKDDIFYLYFEDVIIKNKCQIDFINAICLNENISLYNKFICLDLFFDNKNKYENIQMYIDFCNAFYSNDVELKKYIESHLVFLYLYEYGLNECEKYLYSISNPLKLKNDVTLFRIESECTEVNKIFDKNCSFFYFFKGDIIRANNLRQLYNRNKYKPQKYVAKYSDNAQKYINEFKNDKDFIMLRETIKK